MMTMVLVMNEVDDAVAIAAVAAAVVAAAVAVMIVLDHGDDEKKTMATAIQGRQRGATQRPVI